jgi:carbon storage regulator
MLVLSRKVNEQIIISGGISVTVVRIEGDAVKLGFDAPREIRVNRKEVQDAIDRKRNEKC